MENKKSGENKKFEGCCEKFLKFEGSKKNGFLIAAARFKKKTRPSQNFTFLNPKPLPYYYYKLVVVVVVVVVLLLLNY